MFTPETKDGNNDDGRKQRQMTYAQRQRTTFGQQQRWPSMFQAAGGGPRQTTRRDDRGRLDLNFCPNQRAFAGRLTLDPKLSRAAKGTCIPIQRPRRGTGMSAHSLSAGTSI